MIINLTPVQLKSFLSNLSIITSGTTEATNVYRPNSNLYVLGNLLFSKIRFANSYVHIMCMQVRGLLSYMKYDFIPHSLTSYINILTGEDFLPTF